MTPRKSEDASLRELEGLRELYGKKFNAICAALGHVEEARKLLEDGDEGNAYEEIVAAERILVDA